MRVALTRGRGPVSTPVAWRRWLGYRDWFRDPRACFVFTRMARTRHRIPYTTGGAEFEIERKIEPR
jgi:hypothetical protein